MDRDLAYELLWNFVRTLSNRLRDTNDKMTFLATRPRPAPVGDGLQPPRAHAPGHWRADLSVRAGESEFGAPTDTGLWALERIN